MDNEKNNKEEKAPYWILIIIVVVVVILYYLQAFFIREKKTKELESVKKKIKENKNLNEALESRLKKIFFVIRFIFILAYFGINLWLYKCCCSCSCCLCSPCLKIILNYNTALFIFVSAVTFVRFGSFNSYNKWWEKYEAKVEAYVYEKYPNLKKIIADDTKYKEQLEDEIKKLDL